MPIKARIQRFQAIQDAEIVIDRFTVVTGTNNTGKSSSVRAIRGVFQNLPGTAFIREGEADCKVTLDLGDHQVVWSKGLGKKDRPYYVVDGGDPIYPGQAVPPEVAALGVVPIQAGGQEVWPNIASQFVGQVFLLDKPGSALAEAVADVERVGQLNRALRAAEGDRRQRAVTLKVRQVDLVSQDAALARFSGLDAISDAITALEAQRGQASRIAKAVTSLRGLHDRLHRARGVVQTLTPVTGVQPPNGKEAQHILADLQALRSLRERAHQVRTTVSRYAEVKTLQVLGDAGPSQRFLSALGVLYGLRSRYSEIVQRVAGRQADLKHAEKDLEWAARDAAEVLQEMGCCPTCGTSWGKAS